MIRVDMFLSLWREACRNGIYIVDRDKNWEGITELGFTLEQTREILKKLDPGDYYKGPECDYNPFKKGDLWFFRKDVDGKVVYIKVKLIQREGMVYAKCLSFHPWKGGR